MKPRLVVASLVKNEANKFWASALDAWSQFADTIYVLDDNSTDNTVDIALSKNAIVQTRVISEDAWGAETAARQQLFEWVYKQTEPNTFIMVLDADMVPARNPRPLLETVQSNAIAFSLYDLWAEYEDGTVLYREDKFWRGHLSPRVWAVRHVPAPPEGWQWGTRGIHSGHIPHNYDVSSLAKAPQEYSLLHYAYVDNKRREVKFKQYHSVKMQLSQPEWEHAISILDPVPLLKTLPFKPEFSLKCAS